MRQHTRIASGIEREHVSLFKVDFRAAARAFTHTHTHGCETGGQTISSGKFIQSRLTS
jgi:hypothetical protein